MKPIESDRKVCKKLHNKNFSIALLFTPLHCTALHCTALHWPRSLNRDLPIWHHAKVMIDAISMIYFEQAEFGFPVVSQTQKITS